MSGLSQDGLDSTIERIVVSMGSWLGTSDPPRLVHTSARKMPYSVVARLRVSVDGDERDFFAKIPFAVEPRRIENEFRSLRHYSEKFAGQTRYTVVDPVGFLDDPPALVTEAGPGQPLNAVIKAKARLFPAAATQRSLSRLCRNCGEWLRTFQSFPSYAGGGTDALDDTRKRLHVRLDRCLERELLDAKTIQTLREFVDTRTQAIPATEARVTGMHSDFIPSNILVDVDRVSVLDFMNCRQGLWCRDVATFLYALDGFLTNPMFRAATIDTLKHEFLEGYAWGDSERKDRLFDLFVIGENLGGLLQLSKRKRKGLQAWVFGRLKKRAERTLARILESKSGG